MKEKLKYVLLVILVILAIISMYIILNPKPDKTKEKDAFRVNKMVLYTSANAVSEEQIISDSWDIDIYQYTDIAIYIECLDSKIIDKLYIDNINISKKPELGEANLYKKNLADFARPMVLNNFAEKIEFKVAESMPADFLLSCEKPISISYINNVKQNYIITNIGENLEYDESVLKRAKILTSEIMSQVSFDINIIDTENTKYKCNVVLDIPVEELMSGQKVIEQDNNIKFIKEGMI